MGWVVDSEYAQVYKFAHKFLMMLSGILLRLALLWYVFLGVTSLAYSQVTITDEMGYNSTNFGIEISLSHCKTVLKQCMFVVVRFFFAVHGRLATTKV